MLTRIPAAFTCAQDARAALTDLRRRYRLALRGAAVIGPDYFGAYYVHVQLGSTGFSAAEMAGALRAGDY